MSLADHQDMKVSIIVPVYNVENYVQECIDSLVNQTLKDLQIILIDNGSVDKSSSIIESYARNDSRIEIVKFEKNQGMPNARNAGLKKASGEYVAFVDSDDLCDITMFEKMYRQAKKYNADAITCNVIRFSESTAEGFDHHPNAWYCECDKVMPITCFPEQFMEQAAWAKLIRRKYLEKIDYKFTPGSLCCEDVPAATKIFLNTKRICTLNEGLYYYRDRPGSLSQSMHRKHIDDFIWAMQRQDEIIESMNFDDELTISYIVEMRMLLAIHLLSRMKKEDICYYFEKMKNVFQKYDGTYLDRFWSIYPQSHRIYKLIMDSGYKVYMRRYKSILFPKKRR